MADAQALTNWAGNHRYRATTIHHPRSLDELRRLASSAPALRALGTRHTFSDMGDSGELVAHDQLPGSGEIAVDRQTMTVAVGPTVTYSQLAVALEAQGLALANMASLPHISVVGAAATGTHGSGDRLANLAAAVVGMQLVTSTGDVVELGLEDQRLPGAIVHLGALGIVTRVRLAIEPSYRLSQTVYEGLEWDVLEANLDAITSAGRSVSVFHRFGERVRQVWVKRDASEPPRPQLFGASAATGPRHPLPDADPSNCTTQLGIPGPWHERLPHFKAGFVPSAGEEIQSEWFVARKDGLAAIAALREQLADQIRPLLLISEMRTIAADGFWMSPHHGRDSIAIHFTWRREPEAVAAMCVEVERVLAPFSPRPHWGKVFTATSATITPAYPRLNDFLALREALDPRGAFLNDWFRARLLGDG